ncbi:undecaprenyl/decaprenyl-phosphate alpha-N-acetylglucosaminyl 1-phosphate transferase [Flavobacteriales bacterium]|nr:undecaprenyl/decaprenyl-phosphate alpha-N-acetylglucosaminyl 1-phosphate transferase [Flavobacteriales bacterium]
MNKFFLRRKLYDPINKRSSHKNKATRSGGAAIFLTLCFSYGIGRAFLDLDINLFSLIACCFVAFIGFFDDLFDVKYVEKFALQIFAGIILIQSDVYINNFYGIFGVYEISDLTAYIVSLFVFLVITNSLNLIDGIDGLAGLIALKFFIAISFIIYFTDGSLYSHEVNKESMLAYSLTLIGALIGFLIFNFKSYKKVFLGDFGSLLIGSIITYFIFSILNTDNKVITDNWVNRSLISVLLLIYPLTDTLRVYILRAKSGNSPFLPDRRHLHHKLIDEGYNHVKASILIALLSISVLVFGFGVSFFIWEIDLSSILFEGVNIIATILIILAYMIFLYYKFFQSKVSK